MKLERIGEQKVIDIKNGPRKGEKGLKLKLFVVEDGHETGKWVGAFADEYLLKLKEGSTIDGYFVKSRVWEGQTYYDLYKLTDKIKEELSIHQKLDEINSKLDTLIKGV